MPANPEESGGAGRAYAAHDAGACRSFGATGGGGAKPAENTYRDWWALVRGYGYSTASADRAVA
jgi:hypothetical protein